VNRDLVRIDNEAKDYTSHYYHGKSGYSINQTDDCRVKDNWKIPTDPYGADINTINTKFQDNTGCGESLVGPETTYKFTYTQPDGSSDPGAGVFTIAADDAVASSIVKYLEAMGTDKASILAYLNANNKADKTSTVTVSVTVPANTTIKDAFGNKYANPDGTTGGVSRVIDIRNTDGTTGSTQVNAVERIGQVRYGNPGNVRMEIRYGKDNSLFQLERVYVDYIKAPQHIRLSQEQLDLTEDTSQMMEFPDYVCQEIINELVNLVMENLSDPRLPTHAQVTQSIANPAQQ
jgi:hypothetical protein